MIILVRRVGLTMVFPLVLLLATPPICHAALASPQNRREGSELRGDASREETPRIKAARHVLNWLNDHVIKSKEGPAWPRSIENWETRMVDNLYHGTAGVVRFYRAMKEHVENPRELAVYDRALSRLGRELEEATKESDPGLYTGYSGLGQVFCESKQRDQYQRYIDRCVELLEHSAQWTDESSPQASVTWNGTTDIISGSAGIGAFLLNAADWDTRQDSAFKLAEAAGRHLLSVAEKRPLDDDRTGLSWMMNPEFPREMPNYSHGTAGICDFLLHLHRARVYRSEKFSVPYDGKFLQAAKRGAEYLLSIEAKGSSSGLICHHFPDGEQLFYVGWCHGPAGTISLFENLAKIDPDRRWTKYLERASERLLQMQLHEKRYEGFWDNPGVCCGSAGVGSVLIDRYRSTGDRRFLDAADRICQDILRRGTRGETKNGKPTLCWASAEHRVRPDFIQTQTGLMQGAAGIGLFLLKLEEAHQGRDSVDILPTVLK